MSGRPTRLMMFRSAEKLASITAELAHRDRLYFGSCAQPPARHGFTLASLFPQVTSE